MFDVKECQIPQPEEKKRKNNQDEEMKNPNIGFKSIFVMTWQHEDLATLCRIEAILVQYCSYKSPGAFYTYQDPHISCLNRSFYSSP